MNYCAIVYAVQSKWKKLLKQQCNIGLRNSVDEKLNMFLSRRRPSKFCYHIFLKKVCLDLADTNQLSKREGDLNVSLEQLIQWQDRFKRIFKATLDTKIRTFQFKFIHRRIATNAFLFRIGIKSSSICNFCRKEDQNLIHLFFKCLVVRTFWNDVNKWLIEQFVIYVLISILDICFGFQTRNDFINTIIFYGKYYIFKCKYIDKMPIFNNFQKELMFLEKVERTISLKRGKFSIHIEKWKPVT